MKVKAHQSSDFYFIYRLLGDILPFMRIAVFKQKLWIQGQYDRSAEKFWLSVWL